MLNFFTDQIIVAGISNLDDVAGRPTKIIIGSNSATAHLKKSYFSVSFRMGILEEGVRPTSMPRDELCISLTLDESGLFCETLYNVATRNSETKGPVEIAFTGDNNSEPFAPKTFVKRSAEGWGCRHLAMSITIEPGTSRKHAAKVTLQTRAEGQFFCSAVLSGQDALILSYMIRCAHVDAFRNYLRDRKRSERKKEEPESNRATVLEEAMNYGERVVELTRKHYDPDPDTSNAEFSTEITMLMTQIIQGYRSGPFDKR
jgi:hypothetical protein